MPLFNVSASQSTNTQTSGTGTSLTNTLSTTASKIASSNTARKGLTIYNNLSAILYIDTLNAVTASISAVAIPPNAYYEYPYGYTGDVWGILSTGTGSVQIREYS
jgi:hypothetical protein